MIEKRESTFQAKSKFSWSRKPKMSAIFHCFRPYLKFNVICWHNVINRFSKWLKVHQIDYSFSKEMTENSIMPFLPLSVTIQSVYCKSILQCACVRGVFACFCVWWTSLCLRINTVFRAGFYMLINISSAIQWMTISCDNHHKW